MAKINSDDIRTVKKSKKKKAAFNLLRAIRDLIEGRSKKRIEIDRQTR